MRGSLAEPELRVLYERHVPVIHRRALSILGSESEAWDAVQEVFRRMLETMPSLRQRAQPMTYVYRAITNICLNMLRLRAARASLEAWTAVDTPIRIDPSSVEAADLVRTVLLELDERARFIAMLHFLEGLTQNEIVPVVRLSRKTVGRELQKIRSKIATLSLARKERCAA